MVRVAYRVASLRVGRMRPQDDHRVPSLRRRTSIERLVRGHRRRPSRRLAAAAGSVRVHHSRQRKWWLRGGVGACGSNSVQWDTTRTRLPRRAIRTRLMHNRGSMLCLPQDTTCATLRR